MNKDIERLNAENRRQNEEVSPGDQSQAKFSNIKSNEEDNRQGMAEKIILDLGNQRQDIDSNKEMMKLMIDEINGIKTALNQITQVLNSTAQGTGQPPAKGLNMETISALGDLAEKGVEVYKSLKGSPAPTALIDQDFINKRMVQSFMDDLDTGTSITNFIKDSLKKKVTKEVINSSLADMGKDTHAPQ